MSTAGMGPFGLHHPCQRRHFACRGERQGVEVGSAQYLRSVLGGRTGYVALYEFDPNRDEIIAHKIRHQLEAGYSEW